MKTVKKLTFILSLFIVSQTCVSMETSDQADSQVHAATTRAIFSHKENIFKDLQNDTEHAKFVFFDTLVFTNQQVANTLKKAHDNGAHIEGTVGAHWCNKNMETFFDENNINVSKAPQNHLKIFGMSEKDPRLGSPGKCSLYEGSANPTQYAYHNFETVIQTKNDKPFFMQHFKNHINALEDKTNVVDIHDSTEKKVLKFTPQKENTAFGSHENALNASKVIRIQNLIKSKNEQRTLYITSMNWNSVAMTQALIDAHNDGVTIYVILNRSALEGKGKEQLAQMHKAQVPIYIYDSGENKRTIQHSKVMVRIDGPNYLVVNSTANVTPEGDNENNVDSYYPDSQSIGKEICVELDKLITDSRCKPYTSELAALTENKKTKKRIIFDKANQDEHLFPDINNTAHVRHKKVKK